MSTEIVRSGHTLAALRLKLGDQRCFEVNLFCLPLVGLEVILGMDWLSENYILLDCHRKTIVFGDPVNPSPSSSAFLNANQVDACLKEGDFGYMVLFCLSGEKELKVAELPVVSEFSEVFPDDIPGLPPLREVEFSIDLMPGTGPISIAPYRMSPLRNCRLFKASCVRLSVTA